MRHPLRGTAFCFAVTMFTAATAHAQSDVQLTTFVSQGSIGASRIGAAVDFPLTSNTSLEVEVGYHRCDLDALSSSVNLLYALPRLGRVVPYVAAGAGLANYVTAITGPNNSIIPLTGYALTVNAGGGVKVPVDDNWGFRSDARWYKSFGRTGQEHWRLYNGVTFGTGKR